MDMQDVLAENELVNIFIKKWQYDNPYNNLGLTASNEKFKTDFNAFLNSHNFSKEIKELFLIN